MRASMDGGIVFASENRAEHSTGILQVLHPGTITPILRGRSSGSMAYSDER